MELKEILETYENLKNVFNKATEQPVERVLEKTGFSQKQLDDFVKGNMLYCYTDDKKNLKKRDVITFKIFIFKSESGEELELKDLREVFENTFGEIPYVRFKNKEGHLVLSSEQADKFPDIENMVLKFANGMETKLSIPNLEEKKEFSKNHGVHLEGVLRSRYGRASKFNIEGFLSHKKGIYLGYTKFKSINDIKSIFNKIIKSGQIKQKIEKPESHYLFELLKYHKNAEEKLKDFDHFVLDLHPLHKDTKCFFIVRKDGTKEDFSYVKCLKEISFLIK